MSNTGELVKPKKKNKQLSRQDAFDTRTAQLDKIFDIEPDEYELSLRDHSEKQKIVSGRASSKETRHKDDNDSEDSLDFVLNMDIAYTDNDDDDDYDDTDEIETTNNSNINEAVYYSSSSSSDEDNKNNKDKNDDSRPKKHGLFSRFFGGKNEE